MSVAAFLYAFIKAIPAAQKIFEDVQTLYFNAQEAADINRYDKAKVARDALLQAYKMPGKTDAELKDIRRALYDLRNG